MSRGKIEIITTNCKRCGRSISTLSRSIVGADALKAELGEICESCITPEEDRRILEATMKAAWEQCLNS